MGDNPVLLSVGIAFMGGLIMFLLNKVFDNGVRGMEGDRRAPDQSIVGVYSELLHIMTTVTKIDGGIEELIRVHNDSDSKFSTVRLREEMRELRKELVGDIESLRAVVSAAHHKD